jgi:hypothetical protein
MPELQALYLSSSGKPRVRFFEWKKWLQKIYSELSTQFKPIRAFFSIEKYLTCFSLEELQELNDSCKMYSEKEILDLMEDTPW